MVPFQHRQSSRDFPDIDEFLFDRTLDIGNGRQFVELKLLLVNDTPFIPVSPGVLFPLFYKIVQVFESLVS
jgi:hypothetical protein